jgi:ABC-type spermidine/putrescine transport system permease subunit II
VSGGGGGGGGRLLLDGALGLFTALVLLALYAPVALVVLFSFVPYRQGAVVWDEASLVWYAQLAGNADILAALRRSLLVAAVAVGASLALGAMLALWAESGRAWGRRVVEGLVFLPFLLPPIVTGLSLLVFFRNIDLDRGIVTTTVGHAAFLLAVAYRIVLTRLAALPRSLVEASYDLGASGWQTFRLVLWPHLATAFVTAGLLAFTLSLDETLITVFLAGDTMTLPLRLWAMMRVGFTPEVNALVTVVLVVTGLVTVGVGLRLRRRGELGAAAVEG